MASLTRTIRRGLILDRSNTNKQQRKYILYALRKQKEEAAAAEKSRNEKEN